MLLATELIHGYNRKNNDPRGILKALAIPEKFINWIHQCISTPTFSIFVNGISEGFFKSTKGLRQGDPLSPYLFVLGMEVFSSLLKSRFDACYIHYHPKTSELSITHLMFADDVMVFFYGGCSSLHGITEVLSDFSSWSGLDVNKEKKTLFLADVDNCETTSIASFGFPTCTLPVRYLGLPLMSRKLRIAEYDPLLDKISNRFRAWAVKTLSFAGMVQLTTSVIYGAVNFWSSTFILPQSCLKKIESLCSRFL